MQRQVGWDRETNLLYEIDKQLDKIIKIAGAIPATTTSTTTAAP